MAHFSPRSIEEALALLGGAQPPRIVAGGTDVMVGVPRELAASGVLDIMRLGELRGISRGPEGWRIGAATRWAEIVAHPLPPAFAALQEAAREVGAVQIQNAGTIAGNICNASPAADGVPPLLVLEAEVELAAPGGRRRLPLADFVTGVRRTARRADEIVVALHLPDPAPGTGGAFVKLGSRHSLVISIAMAAAVVRLDGGQIAAARVAVGACSPVAQRLPEWEAALVGRKADDPAALLPDPAHLAPLSPIDDLRASAAYRLAAARELCRRAVMRAARAAGGADD